MSSDGLAGTSYSVPGRQIPSLGRPEDEIFVTLQDGDPLWEQQDGGSGHQGDPKWSGADREHDERALTKGVVYGGLTDYLIRLGQWLTKHSLFLKVLCRVAIVALAVIVLVLGLFSLKTRPASESFTRVGGATSIETAVDASRFWLSPPQFVVETPAGASQFVMLSAAQCAMVLDAPLLFKSQDPTSQRLVRAAMRQWRQTAKGSAVPVMISTPAQGQHCAETHKRTNLKDLSTLRISDPILQLPPLVRRGDTLAPVVVFAAPLAPGDSPDVAVGLALAAHMATPRQKVSLLVVPRYLEADQQLESLLTRQSQTITGGIVLGQTPTVPDDTSALLRQLLTSPDSLSRVTAILTNNLGLAVSLLGLLGLLAVAPQIGELAVLMIDRRYEKSVKPMPPPVIVKGWRWAKPKTGDGGTSTVTIAQEPNPEPRSPTDWASELNGEPVTVWLCSGRTVTGVAAGLQNAAVVQGANPALTVLRLAEATVASKDDAPQGPWSVLIPLGGIDVIGIGVREPSAPNSSPTTQSPEAVLPSHAAAGPEGSSSTGSRRLRLKPTR